MGERHKRFLRSSQGDFQITFIFERYCWFRSYFLPLRPRRKAGASFFGGIRVTDADFKVESVVPGIGFGLRFRRQEELALFVGSHLSAHDPLKPKQDFFGAEWAFFAVKHSSHDGEKFKTKLACPSARKRTEVMLIFIAPCQHKRESRLPRCLKFKPHSRRIVSPWRKAN